MSELEREPIKQWRKWVEHSYEKQSNTEFAKGMACGLQAALNEIWSVEST